MLNIDRIQQIVKKKNQNVTNLVTFLFVTCLNQIFKILNNGCRQSPFNLLNYKLQRDLKK